MIVPPRVMLSLGAALVAWGSSGCAILYSEAFTRRYLDTLRKGPVRLPDGETLWCYMADTPASRARGFMGIDSIRPDEAMLFIFETEERQGFWMKHVGTPLEIAFLDGCGEVLQVTRMVPEKAEGGAGDGADTRYWSRDPIRYALEAGPGFFASHGIAVGVRLEFTRGPLGCQFRKKEESDEHADES